MRQCGCRFWKVALAVLVVVGVVGLLSGCGKTYKPIASADRKKVAAALDVSKVVSVDDELKDLRATIDGNPESASAARAQFRIGVLNEKKVRGPEGSGDREGALAAYNAVLEKYAQTPYAAVAAYRKAELLCDSENPDERKAAVKAYEGVLGMAMMSGGSPKKKGPVPIVPIEAEDGSVKWTPAGDLIPEKLDKLYKERISYQILDALVAFSSRISKNGAHGLAIIFLTVIVKLLLTPLTRKQFQSMKDMQKVQPEVKKLQAKLKGDPQKLNQEVMALYKKRGVNPLGGCFPLLIQMPILIWMYRAIMAFRLQVEGHGFLWVKDLADPDMPMLVMYLLSMFISQKLTTMPTADPQQQQTQKMMAYMMPIMFAFMFQGFPSAFILYWLMFNVLSTTQQLLIMRGQEDEQDRKLGIKSLIPSWPANPSSSAASSAPEQAPAVSPPKELNTASKQSGSSKKKRKRKRRKGK